MNTNGPLCQAGRVHPGIGIVTWMPKTVISLQAKNPSSIGKQSIYTLEVLSMPQVIYCIPVFGINS